MHFKINAILTVEVHRTMVDKQHTDQDKQVYHVAKCIGSFLISTNIYLYIDTIVQHTTIYR